MNFKFQTVYYESRSTFNVFDDLAVRQKILGGRIENTDFTETAHTNVARAQTTRINRPRITDYQPPDSHGNPCLRFHRNRSAHFPDSRERVSRFEIRYKLTARIRALLKKKYFESFFKIRIRFRQSSYRTD